MTRRFRNLAVWMALLGAVAVWAGLSQLDHWGEIGPALKGFYVLSLAAGLIMAVCAALLFTAGGRKALPAWISSAAAGLFGMALIAGILTGTIPCSGPG